MKSILLLLALAFAFNFQVYAQEETSVEDEQIDTAAFEAEFKYVTGKQKLPCNAILNIPAGHKFLGKDQATYVLRDIYGNENMDTAALLGMIIPEGEGILNNNYMVVLSAIKDGYVSDEDVSDMDFDALAEQLIETDTIGNSKFLRWVHNPFYDSELNVLHIPKLYVGKTPDVAAFINLNNWILGKEGYIETITVCDTNQAKKLGDVEKWSKTLVTYDQGFAYADFDESKDAKSAMTLGAIALGGLVLAKKGILAVVIGLIAKFGKIIAVVFFGGIAAFFRNLFKKKDKNTPSDDSGTESAEPTASVE